MSIIVAIDCQDCVMLAATGPSPRATAGPSGSVERLRLAGGRGFQLWAGWNVEEGARAECGME